MHGHKARHIREEQHTDGHALAFALDLGRPCNSNGSAARGQVRNGPALTFATASARA